ncbi:MAG: branched-chain amino acid ABC transporter permease [Desulfobacteraceae bacterium]|nr:branched-chain amino acid ABC transporter permease [Desulfobacteraceae bacterium]
MRNNLSRWIYWVVGLVILAIYPQVVGIYYTNVFVGFAIFGLYAVTLNLLLGYMGVLSFGHAMFFGAGAYSTALALTHIQGFPLLPALLVGGLAGAMLALILCPLLVRVSGTAFAMLTLAFGQLIFVIALKYREVTGGEDGVGGYPIPSFNIPGVVSIDMTDQINFYYFAVTVIIVCLWLLWFYTKTPFGSLVVGVRDNAMRIDYLGFKLPQTKAVNLIVSGCFAGIAGAIYALFQNLVSTLGVLDIGTSFAPILMAYIGGLGSFFGPIVGSAILHLLEDVTFRITEQIELVNGLVFILVVLFAPMGIVGLLRQAKAKWFHKEKVS